MKKNRELKAAPLFDITHHSKLFFVCQVYLFAEVLFMKEIMTKWMNYRTNIILNEVNSSDYLVNVNLVQQYMNNKNDFPLTKWEELLSAARTIISNDNSRYWKTVGQYGTPEKLKGTDPNSVWNVALGLASRNARAELTEPIGTILQRGVRDEFKINFPFLDPSTSPGLHPYWRRSPFFGSLLQITADTFLDLNGILYLLLTLLTGGMGAVSGPVGQLFNRLHTIMKLKSQNSKALSAVQEVEQFARKQINKLVNSPYRSKIIIDQETPVLRFQNIFNFFISQSLEKPVEKFFIALKEETINGLELILKKHGF